MGQYHFVNFHCSRNFKIEMIISCSPIIGCYDNDIRFAVPILHKIEIGFFESPGSICNGNLKMRKVGLTLVIPQL